MVDNDVIVIAAPDGIFAICIRIPVIAKAEPHEAYDDIVCIHPYCLAGKADAVSRGSLAGYRKVPVSDTEFRLEMYPARHIEHNGSRAAFFYGCTQGTGTAVVEVYAVLLIN